MSAAFLQGKITLTKARALQIQAEQVAHYSKFYGPQVAALVAAATTADQLPDEGEIDIVLINRHIPRGGAIEWLIPEKRAAEERHQEAMRAPSPGRRKTPA